MSSFDKRNKAVWAYVFFFWLIPAAWLLHKAVFFLYIRLIGSLRLRAKAADSVPTYPMS